MSELEFNTSAGHEERTTFFADVLLPVPIPRAFTYRVPFEMNDRIGIGFRVVVQFGKKRILTGIVARLHEQPPEEYAAKYILDVLDNRPMMYEKQIRLFHWMSDYYMAAIGDVVNAAMPSGLKLSSESKIQINPEFDPVSTDYEFSDKEQLLLSMLERQEVMTYAEVAQILQMKSYLKIIKSLIAKEAILIFEEVKDKYSPKRVTYIRLADHWLEEGHLEDLMNELEKRPKQLDVLLAYLHYVPVFKDRDLNVRGVPKKKLMERDLSGSSLKTLIKHRVMESYHVIVPRFDLSDAKKGYELILTEAQQKTKENILKQFEKKQTVLLHGITGSGKTEIYIELIKELLEQGEQVLYLLPEIALTTQIVTRLQRVFGDRMGVFHSKYSDNERVEVWKGLIEGRFPLIVGVRSSVFLPFDNLGLVIVDEEHEFSYKQYEPAPRYHARDVAQVLGRIHNAKVLMGTATPSVETFWLARERRYGYVELNERYGEAILPKIIFADLARERREKTIKGDFSALLVEKIAAALDRNEQAIIFQNRRGYSHYVSCEECGWIPKCHSCAVSLTFHMHYNQLRCHYCGHHEALPVTCPACGSSKLRTVGFGTEKLEEDLKILFPEARIQRMDLDTTRRKYSYQKIINDFEERNIDLLVGTQMVSKGLDFDHVTLVGVFDVDRMMHFPDFRAFERTYQLVVQVSGRAGRKDKAGEVVIQTSNVKQPLLHYISYLHYEPFFDREIEERYKYKYPPFYRLIRITIKHKQKERAEQAAKALYDRVRQLIHPDLVLGPHEPMISKLRNLYLMEIMIKIPRGRMNLTTFKQKLLLAANVTRQHKDNKQARIVFDVDPY